jgi:hypothetical protein
MKSKPSLEPENDGRKFSTSSSGSDTDMKKIPGSQSKTSRMLKRPLLYSVIVARLRNEHKLRQLLIRSKTFLLQPSRATRFCVLIPFYWKRPRIDHPWTHPANGSESHGRLSATMDFDKIPFGRHACGSTTTGPSPVLPHASDRSKDESLSTICTTHPWAPQ